MTSEITGLVVIRKHKETIMFKWLKDAFRFDGIQDNEIPPDSDWQWLTPMERIGVQTQFDADCAKRIIEERKKAAGV